MFKKMAQKQHNGKVVDYQPLLDQCEPVGITFHEDSGKTLEGGVTTCNLV